MRMLVALGVILGVSVPTMGWSQQRAEAVKKRGSFSIMAVGGIQQLRMTNAQGDLVGYQGVAKGITMGIEPFDDWMPGFSIFASLFQAGGENKSVSSESFTTNQYDLGINQYLTSWLFLSGGFRSQTVKVSNDTAEESDTTVKGLRFGLGVDALRLGQAWSFSLMMNLHYGYSPNGETQAYNVGSDSVEYLLGVRWTPTVSFSMGPN